MNKAQLRVVSNIGLILGQLTLLFVSRQAGLTIMIASSLFSFPFFIETKMFDVIVLMPVMVVINLCGIFIN